MHSENDSAALDAPALEVPLEKMSRGMGLGGATAANLLTMVGIGPFITIPLLISSMGGPPALWGWLFGAVIALCDGLVWAELAAAMPHSGGSYKYLKVIYGPSGPGRLLSFLFLWQVVLVAPLFAATGAVGFAQYAGHLLPGLTPFGRWGIAALACLVSTALIYRGSRAVGRLSVVWCNVALGTLGCVALGGLMRVPVSRVVDVLHAALHPVGFSLFGLGGATLFALSNFGGYQTACLMGGEIKDPRRVLPRSILLSILIVGVFYLALTLAVLGSRPGPDNAGAHAVVAEMVGRFYGAGAARAVTLLILWTALGSIFTILLGSSRVPYAAAVQGDFFGLFARVHPRGEFPSRAVVAMGLAAAVCSFLPLGALIRAGMVVQIAVQSVAQCAGVIMIRHRHREISLPFRMWLYPVPALVALISWVWILAITGWRYLLLAALVISLGCACYVLRARLSKGVPATAAK